ncbi:MaoC family dehydratase N-terminal domain-containing protein [Actinocorallia sp. API 0066]|uniref:FAS1-like dehydratase domain-containing protein n=1 Tax=Actinocorallia sp. API 0066 TaxID=2896846 RepID=UPI001E364B2A|nr:MaoC family dehydratase N-terminal domain-containing protein [Actinocorallia sp. API 0066]MCD0451544.1 MaoC family dehydratase N-terminal domain-containing protein [Actinocorallia sp. API 0066]
MENWEPHTVTSAELVDPSPVAALAALFDDGLPAPVPGDELPPLWHWVALPRWPVSSVVGLDGHPARGTFLPPVELPRRMFAGGAVAFHAPLRVGATITREASVESVTRKSGRSGELVVVVVRTRLLDGDVLCVEEHQDIIYREAGSPSATAAPVANAAALMPSGAPFQRADAWTWDLTTDPTLLMRFSAATANAHRIHYDWPYTTRVEGYPGLVVHGPLMTLALAEVLRLEGGPGRVTRFRHRNRAPLFCGQPARLVGEPGDGGVALGLYGPGGVEAGPCTSLTVDLD